MLRISRVFDILGEGKIEGKLAFELKKGIKSGIKLHKNCENGIKTNNKYSLQAGGHWFESISPHH